ncbi:MAG: carboxypeptidase-like regulatory domain-containing protein, partial [Acidimicrobiia bacterium]
MPRADRLRTGIRILFLTLIAAMGANASAQTTSGIAADIGGIVTDETGAVLPGATVTVTSNTTGISRTLTTDERGAFLALNLQPGEYSVT